MNAERVDSRQSSLARTARDDCDAFMNRHDMNALINVRMPLWACVSVACTWHRGNEVQSTYELTE